MKLIQLTDLHLPEPGKLIYGLDPYARLDACLTHIATHHSDADFLVITGDLAENGNADAYRWLRNRLKEMTTPARLLVGNEDNRSSYGETFGLCGDFVQDYLDTQVGRFIFLDTLDEGEVAGCLCARRLEWLRLTVSGAGNADLFVFMHHPPFHIGIEPLDALALINMEHFWATLSFAKVRHVFAGHTHIEFRAEGRSTAWPIAHRIGLSEDGVLALVTDAPPAYAVIHVHPNNIDRYSVDVAST